MEISAHPPLQTRPHCLYCGNNPTSHVMAKLDSVLGLTLHPFFSGLQRMPGGRELFNFSEYLIDQLWRAAVFFNIISFNADNIVPPNDRGKVLLEEANRRGWKMETASILGKSLDTYKITLPKGKELVFNGIPRLGLDGNKNAEWIDDKALLKARLEEGGVRVSRGSSFSDLETAISYFSTHDGPVIVKPRFGSRGRHTTTYITELEDFQNAFRVAKQLGHYVIVEEHLIGSVYRATMVDGVLAGVLAGDPPRVTGDGVHTIQELIEIKNNNRHERVAPARVTPMTNIFLGRRGLSLDSILPVGVTIDTTEKIGLSYGGKSREVTPEVHPDLVRALEHAASVVNDPIIGFDFITPDVSVHPDTVRWGIIECNAVPFINLHHDPLEGEPINVASIFLDYLERNMHQIPSH